MRILSKIYFFSIATLILVSCNKDFTISPEQADSFIKLFGSFQWDQGVDVKQTTDGGYAILGTTTTPENGTDLYLIKTDKYGNKEWSKTIGGKNNDLGSAFQITSDGGFVLIGAITDTTSSGSNYTDVFLVKISSSGNEEWSKQIGGIGNQRGNYIQLTSDEGFIITGSTDAIINGETDVFLLKTNSLGDSLWSKTIGFEGNDYGTCVQEDNNNGYIIIGTTSNSKTGQANTNILLVQTNYSGGIRTAETFGGLEFDEGKELQVLSDGYVFTGTTSLGGTTSMILVKLEGNIYSEPVFEKQFGGSNLSEGNAVITTDDGGFALVGSLEFAASKDVYFIKTDEQGDELITERFGGSSDETGFAVEQTSDGGFILVGSTEFEGNSMITLIKINAQGSLKVD
jgi:hypothetical protein